MGDIYHDFLFKEVIKSSASEDGITMELALDQIESNLLNKEKLVTFVTEEMRNHKIITSRTSPYYDGLQEVQMFLKIAHIYKQQQADSTEVDVFIRQMRMLPSFHHAQSISYQKLEQDYQRSLQWQV